MRTGWFALLALPLGLMSHAVALGQGTAPIPAKQAQAKAAALVDELFKDDLARAKNDVSVRTRLAQTFLSEGKETRDNPAGRYVLLMQAHALAAQSGDIATALQAADELAQDFAVPAADIARMKIQILKQASAVSDAPVTAYQSVVDRCLALLDETLDADDYAASTDLAAAAEQAARRLKNVPLVASIRRRQEEVARLRKDFSRWQPFVERLAKNPSDEEAQAKLGEYYAYGKGNWERGLPLLARRNATAALDRTNPTKWDDQRKLALSWTSEASKHEGLEQTHILLRAFGWLQQSLASAPDGQQAKIDAEMQAILKQLPAEFQVGEIAMELRRIDSIYGPFYSAAISPDHRLIASAGSDGILRVWNLRTGKEARQMPGHNGRVWHVAFNADGKQLVTAGYDHSVRLWNLATGREAKIFNGHKDYVRAAALSADGRLLLSGGDDRLLKLWDVAKGTEIRTLVGHQHTIWCAALSRDGKRAISASLDKTARLWDTETGTELKKLVGHSDTVLAVAFSPDGQHALTGSTDRTLRLWDLRTGEVLRTFQGHQGYVHSVSFSPDGRRALSASSDHTIRLWEVASGIELRKLEGHRDQVWSVEFSRDGRLAVSAGQDNTLRIWGR